MSVSVADLIAKTRLNSGLRNNQLFSDDQIATILSDAFADLRDKMIVRFAYWFRKTFDFTLAGGNGGNTLDLSQVPDLQMVQGLDLLDSNDNAFTIDMLESFAQRNQFNTIWPFGGGWGFNGFVGRRYWVDGDTLFVYPAANSAGNYRLVYTPQYTTLALSKTVNFTLDSADHPIVPPPGSLAGTGAWSLANANLANATDIPTSGFDLTLTFVTTNLGFSGTYHVVDVGLPPTFGAPTFSTSNLASSAGFTNPATGTGTYTYQPAGTIGALPQALFPWQKYLILYASIAIRTSRQQQIMPDMETQWKEINSRVVAATKQRSEGVRQAPITRSNYGAGGWGDGFGY